MGGYLLASVVFSCLYVPVFWAIYSVSGMDFSYGDLVISPGLFAV